MKSRLAGGPFDGIADVYGGAGRLGFPELLCLYAEAKMLCISRDGLRGVPYVRAGVIDGVMVYLCGDEPAVAPPARVGATA